MFTEMVVIQVVSTEITTTLNNGDGGSDNDKTVDVACYDNDYCNRISCYINNLHR